MLTDPESKLMVVVLVLIVILFGLAAFLFYLERRLSRSERQLALLEDGIKKSEGDKNPGP